MTRAVIWCLSALLVAACNNGGTNIVLPSLDRSGKIQLLCANLDQPTSFDVEVRSVLPLEACELDPDQWGPDFTPNGLGAITQTQSGEVSAVNFTNRLVFDTNTAVPGFTAFRVGEEPTGIRISPLDPEFIYVSSFSPKTVQAYPTRRILTSDEGDEPPPDPVPPDPNQVTLDAGPTDLALYEVGSAPTEVLNEEGLVIDVLPGNITSRWLYAAIPDLGTVVQIPWDTENNEFGEPTEFTLDDWNCGTVPLVDPPPSDSSDYHRICPDTGPDARDIKTVETTTPCADGAEPGPRPVAVVVDRGRSGSDDDDVLLVADANQPVIHRYQLDPSGGVLLPALDPIVTRTPTVALTITPFVPASFENRTATQRYLYAISAPDRSVLTVEYTPGSPEAVLPVIAGISMRANEEGVESRNRVRSLFANARAIAVVSPEYNLTTNDDGDLVVPAGDLCQPLDSNELSLAQNAANMRGVFLAVSLANGTIFFLDIYDLNATCRGGITPSGDAVGCDTTNEPDSFASIRRHRRRWILTPSSFIEVQGTPALVFDSSQGTLNPETGDPTSSDGPGLDFVTCPESMFSVFGVDPVGATDGLICASSQVWSSFSQGWEATWGGLIPTSEGGLGLFSDESFSGEPGNWFQAGDVPFCQIGVLGPTELPGAEGIPGLENTAYGGDRLLITGELPPNRVDDPVCEDFEDLQAEIDDSPVWFPIVRAFNDELEIGPSPNPNRYTLDQVRFCFDQFTEYQIHTQDAYTVVGTESGFIHRTTTDMSGECVLDDSRPITAPGGVLDVDTVLSGRAFPGVQFINPLVSFEIQPFNEDAQPTDRTFALLTFNIFNGFSVLLLDTGGSLPSLPSSMLFSSRFEQLYFVDLQRGIRQIAFEPLSTLQLFE